MHAAPMVAQTHSVVAVPAVHHVAAPTFASMPATYASAPAYAAAPAATVVHASPPVAYAAPTSVVAGTGIYATFQNSGGPITKDMAKKLRKEFNKADTTKAGELDHIELSQVMRNCGFPDAQTDPAALQKKFSEYDADGSGKVSFSEFMGTFHTKPNSPGPKEGEGKTGNDGKYTDNSFPPTNESIYNSPNPAADHVQDVVNHAGTGTVTWKRASDLCADKQGKACLFKSVQPNDIAQGILGDCWFLAALAGLAEFDGAIFNLFQQKKVAPDCKYTINIFNPVTKAWDSVTIDDFVPTVKGEPLMAKPQDHEMWVLLLEKAFAKWFGSYCQIQGAYCMVAYMLLVECGGPCTVFTQSMKGMAPFNEESYHVVDASLKDAKNRNSVGLAPKGTMSKDIVWEELKKADASNHVMAAWTCKDPEQATGKGASGEIIASDGIVKGHAYSLISAKEVRRDDGELVRVVQLRNPWGANPAAEYKGELADDWSEWKNYPNMKKELLGEGGKLDGMFWMTFENFVKRYSDCGIVPKAMETPRLGQMDAVQEGGKHGKRPKTALKPAAPASSKAKKAKDGKKKKGGCC